jgi:hypothetical protein
MLKWVIWLALVPVAIFWLRRSRGELAVATNALLAEHYLSLHGVENDSPFSRQLADSVCSLSRASGFPNAAEDVVARQFNRHDRFTQLNVIAVALHHGGIEPPLPREFWRPIRNPFLSKRDQASIHAALARLSRDHGVNIDLGQARLRFVDGHIVNS